MTKYEKLCRIQALRQQMEQIETKINDVIDEMLEIEEAAVYESEQEAINEEEKERAEDKEKSDQTAI
ncbi:hypothetical protein [Salipaludibacillus agaradhaerens]|uniref:hypothetical protein n=1 Tax=Salipaludibacillus agaradhaerens TaxID=76935 RepID=UPI000997AB6A|nr:hypothetical protein [Salipaludibacillus agaradhaerens]